MRQKCICLWSKLYTLPRGSKRGSFKSTPLELILVVPLAFNSSVPSSCLERSFLLTTDHVSFINLKTTNMYLLRSEKLGLIYMLLDCSRVYNNTVQTFKEEVSSIKDAYQAFIIFPPPLASVCCLK